MRPALLAFGELDAGIQQGTLDLSLLYRDSRTRNQFERNWPEFLASDPANAHVFRREGDHLLVFRTESLIPTKADSRPPVILLLGNPASHSVLSGMCFAFEGDGHEHRFWVALRETGFLTFHSDAMGSPLADPERNRARKRELLNLLYDSPFRIGVTMYFSIPSAASAPQWAGVAGLRRLFGGQALQAIATEERQRLERIIWGFAPSVGGVVAFQRDAYEGVRTATTPIYSQAEAMRGVLRGTCQCDPGIYLLGAPPTRLLQSHSARQALIQIREYLVASLTRPSGQGRNRSA